MRKKRRQIDMPPSYVIEHLDEAIEKHWVRVHYQPIMRTITGQLCAMEGLARWDDPNWGFLTPPFFIGILEQHNLIHKLDAFLIEEVCRNQARVRKAGLPSVPVSLNLSRLDFINCDIFEVVENAVRKYNVPRDLLHLEIVENILTDRNKKIGEVLDRFRAAGYEIWMDDFGSGYSSLKFLKDQRFDVLKMDMAFLKRDTQRARDIIISIISMDKRIGNRTLAEGVETQEQFEFLREIGCEKIQGYYLGRPRPYDETINNCLEKGISVELNCWKAYYDAIMEVDFLTGHALLLIEYRDHAYHILFANQKSRELFWQGDVEKCKKWEEAFNTYNQPAVRYLRRGLRRVMLSGEDEELAYPLDGDFIMMDCHRVIAYNGRCLLSVNCRLHKVAHEGDLFRPAYLLRNLFYLYDKVATFNLAKNEAIELTQPQLRSGLRKAPLDEALREYREQEVYHADRKRFAEFFDVKTIPERVAASKLGSIVEAFRTKGPDGSLIWKTHRLTRISSSQGDIYFCVVRVSDAQDLADYDAKCWNQYVLRADTGVDSADLLWRNFITGFPLPAFWKDAKRCFCGVNQRFLDFYDFDSVQDLAERTDEDMNWHVHPEPFARDEHDVLEKGITLRDVPGQCLARGVQRDILATKWPIYDAKGNIAGLMGYFVSAEALARVQQQSHKAAFVDAVTGTANVKGLLFLLAQYLDEYRFGHRNFVAIFIKIRAIDRLLRRYGEEACDELLHCIAEEIRRVLGPVGASGRFGRNQFLVFSQYNSQEEVRDLGQRLRTGIESIHNFGQRSCTLFVELHMAYPQDQSDFYEDIITALLGRSRKK